MSFTDPPGSFCAITQWTRKVFSRNDWRADQKRPYLCFWILRGAEKFSGGRLRERRCRRMKRGLAILDTCAPREPMRKETQTYLTPQEIARQPAALPIRMDR